MTTADNIKSPPVELSVVVIALNSGKLLGQCVSALATQERSFEMEIHVVSKTPEPEGFQRLAKPAVVCWHHVGPEQTVPIMRRTGIGQATARIIALLEDDCMVAPQWMSSLLAAHNGGQRVVGGPVEAGDFKHARDWAVYYCEFGRFAEPFSGEVNALSGTNVSYRTEDLLPEQMQHGFIDVFAHQTMRDSGHTLFAASEALVINQNSWSTRACSVAAFHHGRAYAAQRFETGFSLKRLVYALFSPLLPLLKTARTLQEIRTSKRRDLPVVKPLPWVIMFHLCWSAGEMTGYIAGPGRSIEQWR